MVRSDMEDSRRRRPRQRLIDRRIDRELKQDDVAVALGVDVSTIKRLEQGITGTSALWGKRHALAEVLDVPVAQVRRWLDNGPERHVVPESLTVYGMTESSASKIEAFGPHVIHALAETRGYAHSLINAGDLAQNNGFDPDQLVEMRMDRQDSLKRSELHLVLVETALTTVVGDLDVMCDQLDHLAAVARRPNVTVQIVTFTSGPHPGTRGEFTILTLPGGKATVYLEPYVGGASYIENEHEIGFFAGLFNRLCHQAEPPEDTGSLIQRAKDRIIREHTRSQVA